MKGKNVTTIAAALSILMYSCQMGKNNKKMEGLEKGTFGYDLEFLKEKDSSILVLSTSSDGAHIIVSPKYQGKVFTSTVDGKRGKSFGWINYKAFQEKLDPHMNGYGGEDRLWLGPEGGKYSIFFKPGVEMTFDNWHTPPAIDSESWKLDSANAKKVSLSKQIQLTNYAGTDLKLSIGRDVEILESTQIQGMLDITLDDKVKVVGFRTLNTLTNTGRTAWTKDGGAPVMWNLGMFTPSPSTVIVIPYRKEAKVKIATTDYFGEIDSNRIVYEDSTLLFLADGKSRGKLGISPLRAKPIAGSYDSANKVLTITYFDVKYTGTYLNQEWGTKKNAFLGDAVNAYNDGPLEDSTQMGPFYEIESVSPVAYLSPGEATSHLHCVFHFVGEKAALDMISKKVLGVSIAKVENAFK